MSSDSARNIRTVDEAGWIAGFVTGDGTFTRLAESRSGFVFAVAVGEADRGVCERMRDFFGIGNVFSSTRRQAHYEDVVVFRVKRLRDLIEVIVPFMDEHLPPSYKRGQYLAWRSELLEYWETKAKRVRPCTIEGCDAPRRAHGLCRRHLYLERGY